MDNKIAEHKEIMRLADAMAKAVDPQRIYLFGSFATGMQNNNSDYDFYIVVDNDKDVLDDYLLARRSIREIKTRSVDILVQEEHKFVERSKWLNSVQHNIDKEGLLVYER